MIFPRVYSNHNITYYEVLIKVVKAATRTPLQHEKKD